MAPVAREATGGSLRPSRLVTHLGVDKSLASRFIRGLRTETDFELVHFIPAPTGLRILLDAAESAGIPLALTAPARQAVDDFEAFLDEVPGGRGALDTVLSEQVEEVRQRAERTAKQSVYRGMTHLLGVHCEAVSSALILVPHEDGRTVDGLDASHRAGIRRLRPGAPVALFSIDVAASPRDKGRGEARDESSGPYLEGLDGSPLSADSAMFLIPEMCTPAEPRLEIHRDGTHVVWALPDEDIALDRTVTITSAVAIRRGFRRYRTEQQDEDSRAYLLHHPTKLLVRDLYIRDDLYVGAVPEIRLEFPSPAGSSPRTRGSLPLRMNTLDLVAPVEQLGRGTARVSTPGIPDHGPMVRHLFDRAGLDPARFQGYRARIVHPVPMILMGWWIPLPRPSSTV
jgi:hypothetical protein